MTTIDTLYKIADENGINIHELNFDEIIFVPSNIAVDVKKIDKNIDYISVILWGYVLIWYACGDGMFIVQTPRSEASCECET